MKIKVSHSAICIDVLLNSCDSCTVGGIFAFLTYQQEKIMITFHIFYYQLYPRIQNLSSKKFETLASNANYAGF